MPCHYHTVQAREAVAASLSDAVERVGRLLGRAINQVTPRLTRVADRLSDRKAPAMVLIAVAAIARERPAIFATATYAVACAAHTCDLIGNTQHCRGSCRPAPAHILVRPQAQRRFQHTSAALQCADTGALRVSRLATRAAAGDDGLHVAIVISTLAWYVQAYFADSFGERNWVDLDETKPFTENILTIFGRCSDEADAQQPVESAHHDPAITLAPAAVHATSTAGRHT